MEDERKKYLDCLLADFSSIKEEIRRRSTLQRFVLVGFLTVLALTFREMASNTLTSSWITGLWLSSFLALLFYSREGLEIGRLGIIIKEPIAISAARELRVGWTEIFHSETNQAAERIDPVTAFYYALFNRIVFLGLPALVTLKFVWPVLYDLDDKLSEHLLEALLSFLAAGWVYNSSALMESRNDLPPTLPRTSKETAYISSTPMGRSNEPFDYFSYFWVCDFCVTLQFFVFSGRGGRRA